MKPQKTPRHIDQLVELANAGAGLRLEASKRPLEHLVSLAEAAFLGGGTVYLRGLDDLGLDRLLQIAKAGQSHVVFEMDEPHHE